MGDLITLLGSVSAGAVLGWVVAIFLAVVAIYKWVEKYRKARNKYDETQKLAEENSKDLQKLEQDFEDNKLKEQTRFLELETKDKEIIDKIDEVAISVKDLQIYQKKRDMNSLKVRIEHEYKTIMSRADMNGGRPFITENELEGLRGLIESYEEVGGNSFIHTKVIPAMVDWEEITEDELKEKIKGATRG